jgi:hypothetical protein
LGLFCKEIDLIVDGWRSNVEGLEQILHFAKFLISASHKSGLRIELEEGLPRTAFCLASNEIEIKSAFILLIFC